MKYILYSVLFITLLSCNKKQENKPIQKVEKEYIDDPLVYEVINAVLEMPEIKKDSAKYMLNTANMFLFDLGMDGEDFYFHAEKYFGNIDTLSIQKQINQLKNSYYQKDKINNIEVIDYDLTNIRTDQQLDSLNKSMYKYTPNISIGLIFNTEKNSAFITYEYYPHYGKYIFVSKENGTWTFSDAFGVSVF